MSTRRKDHNEDAGRIRVLCADDTPLDVDHIHGAMQADPSVEFCICASPAELEAHLAEARWDVLIAELNVFGWGTFGLLDRMHAAHPEIPVAIIAGVSPGDLADEARSHGAAEYIRKADIDARGLPRLLRHIARERKLSTESLRLLNERDLLFANSTDMLAVTDFNGRFRVINPAWTRTLGWTPDELKAASWIEFAHPDDKPATAEALRTLQGGTALTRLKNRCRHKNGGYRVLSWNCSPLVSERLAVAVARDVTEEMGTIERLRLLHTAADAAANGIVITDRQGVIVWANAAFTKLTGYDRDEAIGHTPRIMKSGRQSSDFYASLWAVIVDGRVWRGELINRRKDGSTYHEEMTITPLRAETGAVTHFIAIKEDVTERIRLREQLAQAQKMESIGHLAGGVAHDFNNVLQAILGYSEILLVGMKPDDPAAADVEQIRTAARHAANLTRQLLAFSRRQLIMPEPIDINAVVRGSGGLLERVIGEHIRLDLDLADGLRHVMADPGQVESIIMNLAVNARDAMPNGGRLTISTRAAQFQESDLRFITDARPGRFVALSITDSGVGMDAEVAKHIFEPFFTTKGVGKGTGMGLSTVYGIVHQHNGWIHVYTERGHGTCMKVYLPTADQRAEPGGEAADAPAEPLGDGKRILVVEDEESICMLAGRVLREAGYHVTMANSAYEAREVFLAANGRFDLLFCDVVLPDMNGVELVDHLLRENPAMAVLMVSGYPDDIARWETIRARGHAFLQKPYPARDLLRAIRDTLER